MPSTGINNATLVGVYISGTLVSHGTGHSLSLGNDVFEITSKDSAGWKEIKPGLRNWSISGEFRFAEDAGYGFTDLFALVNGRTQFGLRFSSSTAGDLFYHGVGYLTSLEMSGDMEDAQGFSATFEGSGVLGEATVS
jgi:predicted secreted protein